MIRLCAPRPSAGQAVAILRRVFRDLRGGLAFRLWDGTEVPLGASSPVCTVVVHAPETLARLMRDPTPLSFAEAYVGSAIDIEGDLFAAMKVADEIEALELPLLERLRILLGLCGGLGKGPR